MSNNKTLQMTRDGDIHEDAFKPNSGILDDEQGIAQDLRVLLNTIRGEDPFDDDHGLRVFEAVSAGFAVLRREIRLALVQDDRVSAVPEIRVQGCDQLGCENIPEKYEQQQRGRFVRIIVELEGGENIELEDTV